MEARHPIRLHHTPVLNLAVSDRVTDGVGLVCLDGLETDRIRQILHSTTAAAALPALVRDGDGRGDNKLGVHVAGKAHLCESGSVVNDNGRRTGGDDHLVNCCCRL